MTNTQFISSTTIIRHKESTETRAECNAKWHGEHIPYTAGVNRPRIRTAKSTATDTDE